MITTVPGQGTYDLGVEIGLVRGATVDAGHHVVLHHTPGPPVSDTKDLTGMPAYFWVHGTEVTFWPAPSEAWEIDFQFYGPLQQAVWPVPVPVVDVDLDHPRVAKTAKKKH